MRVAFLNNQIDNRGTGNALFDYAHYNEEILGNESLIISMDNSPRDPLMEARLLFRFGKIYTRKDIRPDTDVLYHIKYGTDDGISTTKDVRYAVHAVFDGSEPHGDRYAVVSSWLGNRFSCQFVPHIVTLPDHRQNLRQSLGIHPASTVFGRHGGPDTFDIPWAWDAIASALKERDGLYFLFMGTNVPNHPVVKNPRVIFVDATSSPFEKRTFINTCDAMLHARQRGETFGIAVGEFDICGKPVLTYGGSPEGAHYEELGNFYIYHNQQHLEEALIEKWSMVSPSGYSKYTPENVMKKFKEVFLD